MAKKGITQKLKEENEALRKELEEYKGFLAKSEANMKSFQDQAEDAFIASPTYIQMQETIQFQKNLINANDISRGKAIARNNKTIEAAQKVFEDNKKFLENDGNSNYFIGITDCFKDLLEVNNFKTQISELKGQLEGAKISIKEREEEINRLTWKVGELLHEQKNATTLPSPTPDLKLQEEYQEAIRLRDLYEERYDKEKKKAEKLEDDIEKLKVELQGQISDKDISDDDLSKVIKLDIKWYYSYWNFDKSELVRKLKYSETISERRRIQIIELKKQLRNNRYEQYVQEDAITYEEALNKISRLESNLRDFQGYFETWFNRSEELEQELAKYAATTLPPEEAGEIVGKNIQENNKLKSQIKKKSGRPAKVDEHQVALIKVLHEQGHSMRKIADQIGCSVGTVHRLLQK